MVSPDINAGALAAALPRAKLVILKEIGHMPHHAASDIIVTAIDELVPRAQIPRSTPGYGKLICPRMSRSQDPHS